MDLESSLSAARDGEKSIAEFLEELFQSQIVVLLDKEIGENGHWNPSAVPLILSDPAGISMLAIFTSLDRAAPWVTQYPSHPHALLVDFSWVVKGIRNDVGIAINPGYELGAEINPETTAQIREFAQSQPAT